MKKYLTYFKVYWQDVLNYRFDTAVYAFSGIVTPFMGLFVWIAIARNNSQLGMSLNDIVVYFLTVALFTQLTNTWGAYFISEEIKSGKISGYFLKPFSILENFMTNNIAEKTVKFIIVGSTVVVTGLFFNLQMGVSYSLKWEMLPLVIIALLFSIVMMNLIDVSIGLTAFWFDDVDFLLNSFIFSDLLLSGKIVPIQFLPFAAQQLSFYLPFRYIVSFPIEMILGKLNVFQIIYGFGILVFWTLVFYLIQKFLYQKGIKRYQGFGG